MAETHSNSHMHLNTFLPFVYAVSMVSATHMENAENKNRVKLSHLQLSALMWVGKKLTQNQAMSSYKWIARFDFRLGMPMAWCSWWQKDIFTYSTLKPMTGEAITRHMSFNWFQLILRLLEEDVNLGNFQLSIRQRKVLLECSYVSIWREGEGLNVHTIHLIWIFVKKSTLQKIFARSQNSFYRWC